MGSGQFQGAGGRLEQQGSVPDDGSCWDDWNNSFMFMIVTINVLYYTANFSYVCRNSGPPSAFEEFTMKIFKSTKKCCEQIT